MPRLAVITGFLSKTKDRFHEYNDSRSLEDRFKVLSGIEGYSGAECVFPYETGDQAAFKALMAKYGLEPAAINVNVKAEPEFRNGGLTSTDPAIRAKAVRFIKEAKDFAQAVGADKVTCCPLGDGYEFAFQYDYRETWKHLIEALGDAGSYKREIPLFLEYKPSETRGKCFLDTASKTLYLLDRLSIKGMGVTLDFGHSIYGGENPAEAAALILESPYGLYVHINDNDGRWDWDYFCGTKHYLDYVEFLYYLRRGGYDDFMTSDTSPTRWDIKGTFEANSRLTNKIWRLLEVVDGNELARLLAGGKYLETWKFIEREFFGLKE